MMPEISYYIHGNISWNTCKYSLKIHNSNQTNRGTKTKWCDIDRQNRCRQTNMLAIAIFLTLTLLNPTKSNKEKWRKCAKSHYIKEAGIIWARNRCPGSDTLVACQGWTVRCGARGPQFVYSGEPPFLDPSLSKKSLLGVRVKIQKHFYTCIQMHTHLKKNNNNNTYWRNNFNVIRNWILKGVFEYSSIPF